MLIRQRVWFVSSSLELASVRVTLSPISPILCLIKVRHNQRTLNGNVSKCAEMASGRTVQRAPTQRVSSDAKKFSTSTTIYQLFKLQLKGTIETYAHCASAVYGVNTVAKCTNDNMEWKPYATVCRTAPRWQTYRFALAREDFLGVKETHEIVESSVPRATYRVPHGR